MLSPKKKIIFAPNIILNIMIVYVNDTPVKTYYGAKVKSAIMAYFRDQNLSTKTEVKEVRDAYRNLLDMDGSIRANSKIYIKL